MVNGTPINFFTLTNTLPHTQQASTLTLIPTIQTCLSTYDHTLTLSQLVFLSSIRVSFSSLSLYLSLSLTHTHILRHSGENRSTQIVFYRCSICIEKFCCWCCFAATYKETEVLKFLYLLQKNENCQSIKKFNGSNKSIFKQEVALIGCTVLQDFT